MKIDAERLKEGIKGLKRSLKESEVNQDYYIGYMSALSTLPDIFPALTFEGTYDKNKKYSVGDVVMFSGGVTKIFNGEEFVEVGDNSLTNTTIKQKEDLSPFRCKCCGGTLIRYGSVTRCEYCDTEYV